MSLFNYECDEVKRIIQIVSPNYPQLITYEREWIYFYENEYTPGTPVELEYETVIINPTGSISNAIPFNYKSAILKGNTKYRDALTNIVFGTYKEAVEVWSTNTYQLRDSQGGGTPGTIGSGTDVITLDFCGVNRSSYILTGDCMYKKAVFYNNNYEYIKSYRTGGTTDDLIISEIPENACYVRFSFFPYNDNSGTCSVVDKNYNPINLREIELASVKMPVLTTTGKNLFDGELKVGGLVSNGAIDYNLSDRIVSYNFIPIKNNMQYKLSSADNLLVSRICFYDNNKQFISQSYTTDFISPTNAKYLRFAFMDTENIEYQIMLEEGSTASTYEPYQTNILSTPSDLELRGIGEVKDELDLLTGELTQRIGEVVLDGSQTLQPHSIVQGDTLMIKISDASISFKQNSNLQESWDFSDMICDKELIAETPKWNANEWNEDYNIALISSASSDTYNINSFVLAIRMSYFNVQSIDEFKTWLTQNPLTIQYKLAKESIKIVDLTPLIKPYEGVNHYHLTSNIPCESILEVPVVSTGEQTLQEINNY